MTIKRPAAAANGPAQRTPDQQAVYDLLRESESPRYQAAADTDAGAEFVATVAAYLPTIRQAYAHMDETQMAQPGTELNLKIGRFWKAAQRIADKWAVLDEAERLVVARQAAQCPGWPRQDGDTNAAFVARTGKHIAAFVAPFADELHHKPEKDPDKMKRGRVSVRHIHGEQLPADLDLDNLRNLRRQGLVEETVIEQGHLYVSSCERHKMKDNLDLDAILYLRGAVVDILKLPAAVTPGGPFMCLAADFLNLVGGPGRGSNIYEKAREAVGDGHQQLFFRCNRQVND